MVAVVAVISLAGVLPLGRAIHAGTLERSLYQRSSGSARRAPIQRSSSRRSLRIVSYVAAGIGSFVLHPCQRSMLLDLPVWQEPELQPGDGPAATPTPPPPPEAAVNATPERDEYSLNLSGQVFHYSPWLPANLPFFCATEPLGADRAFVVPPDGGDPIPAQVTQISDGAYLITLPIDTLVQPGAWTLVVEDGERHEVRMDIAPFTAPAIVVEGDTLLITGFRPGEWVKLLFFGNGQGGAFGSIAREEQGEASFLADERGSIYVLLDEDYWTLAVGEETAGYVTDLYRDSSGSAFYYDLSVQRTPDEQIAANEPNAPSARMPLQLELELDLDAVFGGSAKAEFFPPDERPTAEPPVTVTPTPTRVKQEPLPPHRLPVTGAARMPAASAAVLGLAVIALLAAVAVATRSRKQP